MAAGIRYVTLEEVLYLHDRIIKQTGGRRGIRGLGLLDSAVHRPAATFGGEELYPDLFMKAAALVHSLVNNHPFVDGNKRTAYAAAAWFLFANGHALRSTKREIVDFLLGIEAKTRPLDSIAAWLKTSARRAAARRRP